MEDTLIDSNENISHVNCVEGLFSQINEHLKKIKANYPMEKTAKDQLVEEIDLIQKTSLHNLRTLCEGD